MAVWSTATNNMAFLFLLGKEQIHRSKKKAHTLKPRQPPSCDKQRQKAAWKGLLFFHLYNIAVIEALKEYEYFWTI